ncbi:MAG: hypothetical protein KDA79_00915 [Planctomycetaceae bacterium]|nr:hypothetical protein [Planctomycetaceae bacterium]
MTPEPAGAAQNGQAVTGPQQVARWISRCRRRLAAGRFLQLAADWLLVYLFVFGTIVLTVRLGAAWLWPNVLWLGLAVVPVLALAWWKSREGRFTERESVALLDRRLGAGGLLMTLVETPDGRWSGQLPAATRQWLDSLPKVRPSRFFRTVLLPAAFAVGACFVPLREGRSGPHLESTVGQQAATDLESSLELLEDAQLIEKEEQEELREEIEQLAAETGSKPLTHEKWETVDSLRERLQMKVAGASMSVSQAREAASLLGRALGEKGSLLTVEQQDQLSKELLEALKKLSPDGSFSGAGGDLASELQRLTKNGQLQLPQDAAARQQMLDQLQDYLDQQEQKLAQLREKVGQGGQCEGGQCQNPGGQKMANGNRPGRGGVTRGRGDADMTWGDESDRQGTKFKETILPPGFADQPGQMVLGESAREPEVDPAAVAARGEQRLSDPSAGRATWNRRLRPRHRQAVRNYFDSREQ